MCLSNEIEKVCEILDEPTKDIPEGKMLEGSIDTETVKVYNLRSKDPNGNFQLLYDDEFRKDIQMTLYTGTKENQDVSFVENSSIQLQRALHVRQLVHGWFSAWGALVQCLLSECDRVAIPPANNHTWASAKQAQQRLEKRDRTHRWLGRARLASSALHLAAAGRRAPSSSSIRTTVELSNLNRRVLHWDEDVGKAKSRPQHRRKWRRINPTTQRRRRSIWPSTTRMSFELTKNAATSFSTLCDNFAVQVHAKCGGCRSQRPPDPRRRYTATRGGSQPWCPARRRALSVSILTLRRARCFPC